jgi:hypothetical protein
MSTNGNGKHPSKPNGTAAPASFDEPTTEDENEPTAEEKTTALRETSKNPVEHPVDVATSAEVFWKYTLEEIKDLLESFKNCSSRTEKVSAAQAFVTRANDTPYLTADAKTCVEKITTASRSVAVCDTDTVTPTLAGATGAPASKPTCEEMLLQLNSEQQEWCSAFKGKQKEDIVRMMYMREKDFALELAMKEKDFALELAMNGKDFEVYIHQVVSATSKVTGQLRALAGLSEAEGTTFPNMGTNTRTAAQDYASKRQKMETDMPDLAVPQDIYMEVITKAEPLEKVLPLKLPKLDQTTQLECRLLFVDRVLTLYLNRAVFMQHKKHKDGKMTDAEYKKEMRNATEAIYVAATAALRSTDLNADATIEKILNSREGNWWAPAADTREVEGTQPWLSLVVRLVGYCVQPPFTVVPSPPSEPNTSTPVKTKYRSEAIVLKLSNPIARKCDIMLGNDGRHAFIVFDDAIYLGGEEKPGSRGSKGPEELFQQAQDQVLSHCAKHLMVGLNFAGAGVPSHATGFIANIAAIQVVQLRLEGVGTPDAKLVLYKSEALPLIAKENFQSWTNTAPKARQKDFEDFGKQLYGNDEAASNDKIPLGIQALCSLMKKQRKDLFGPTVDAVGGKLGGVIGNGAFSVVFKSRSDSSCAIKISRYGRCMDIKHEAKILRHLGASARPPSIPKLVNESKITVRFGDVKRDLLAITTKPVGVPLLLAYSLICTPHDESKVPVTWVQQVLSDCSGALKFMHDTGIFHRDVNPKNIIVVANERKAQAILIDFSIAFDVRDKQALGFSGTVNYAHRELFQYYPDKAHTPEAKHDWAGLGLTMAMLVNGCSLPWNPIVGFPTTITPNNGQAEVLLELMKARLEFARGAVNKLGVGDNDSEKNLEAELLRMLAHDET